MGLALAFALSVAWPTSALEPIYQTTFGDVAIRGYDPVAYFTTGKATKGDSDHSFEWTGANWYFDSEENRNLFKANPEKYAPQFGGYCAYAVAKNSTAKTDPEAWTIVDGKLYLNYSKKIRDQWKEDQAANIVKGHKNWPGLLAGD